MDDGDAGSYYGRKQSQDNISSRPPSSSILRPRSSLHSTVAGGGGPGIVAGSANKCFLTSVTGSIESARIFGVNNIYCKYNYVYGPDWQITAVSITFIARGITFTANLKAPRMLTGNGGRHLPNHGERQERAACVELSNRSDFQINKSVWM